MNVLVVDDNESVAESLAFALECYGHRAVVAYDGETALKLLRTGAFELTFLDENLPGIRGSAVALSLMQMPAYPEPFVVSMTGDVDNREDVAWLFDVCLQKPFASETLIKVIEDARKTSDASALLVA